MKFKFSWINEKRYVELKQDFFYGTLKHTSIPWKQHAVLLTSIVVAEANRLLLAKKSNMINQ